MSVNVIRPSAWLDNGRVSLETEKTADGPDVAGGGGGPHDPTMDARMATLEAGMGEIRLSLARIEEALKHVATKAEVSKVEGKVDTLDARVVALDARVGRVETAINDTVKAAVAKSIGPAQLPVVLGACIVVVGALFGGFVWLATKLGFLHP